VAIVVIPNQPSGTAVPLAPPEARDHFMKVKSLGIICKLHIF
jgi:hypothetical protein